jgi:hypothetical protein
MSIEIKDIIEKNDFIVKVPYSKSLGNAPSRTKINDMVAEWTNGVILDGKLTQNSRFLAVGTDNKWFLMMYYKADDVYLFEKMTKR